MRYLHYFLLLFLMVLNAQPVIKGPVEDHRLTAVVFLFTAISDPKLTEAEMQMRHSLLSRQYHLTTSESELLKTLANEHRLVLTAINNSLKAATLAASPVERAQTFEKLNNQSALAFEKAGRDFVTGLSLRSLERLRIHSQPPTTGPVIVRKP